MTIEIEFVGGCTCISGDVYCYCNSRDLEVYFTCPGYRVASKIAPYRKCNQPKIKIDELSDYGSLGRWLTEHYNAHQPNIIPGFTIPGMCVCGHPIDIHSTVDVVRQHHIEYGS